MLKISPHVEEVRVAARLEVQRQSTIEALDVLFPGAVPSAVVDRINAETDLARLRTWFGFAIRADLAAIQADMA
jgi:hypothetical protein